MTTIVGWGVAVLALVALATASREGSRRRGDGWARVALVVLAVGSVWSASTWWEEVLWSKAVVATGFLALVAGHVLTRRARRPDGHPALAPVLAALALWSWLALSDVVQNPVSGSVLLGRSLSGLVLLAALAVVLTGGLALRDVRLAATCATATLCLSVPLSETSWRACDTWSCGVAGALMTGPFRSENAFGVQAALLVALTVGGGGSRPARVCAGVLGVAVLVLSAAKTAAVALAVAVVLLGTFRVLSRRGGPGRRAPLVATAVASGTALAGVLLLLTATPDAWSNRGLVWIRSLEVLEGDLLTGAGLSRYQDLQAVGLVSTHFTHSLYLYALFSGGVVGLVLLVVTGSTMLSAHLRDGWWAAAPVLLVLVTGLLESVWNPLTVDATTWVAVALLVAVPAARARPPRSTAGSPTAAPDLAVQRRAPAR